MLVALGILRFLVLSAVAQARKPRGFDVAPAVLVALVSILGHAMAPALMSVVIWWWQALQARRVHRDVPVFQRLSGISWFSYRFPGFQRGV